MLLLCEYTINNKKKKPSNTALTKKFQNTHCLKLIQTMLNCQILTTLSYQFQTSMFQIDWREVKKPIIYKQNSQEGITSQERRLNGCLEEKTEE